MGWKDAPVVQPAKKGKWADAPVVDAEGSLPTAAPETFTEGLLGGAASTADLLAGSAVGAAQWVSYPFRRVAGLVTGETADDIAASQERVMGAVGSPVGSALGVADKPSYQNNLIRQAVNYVGGLMDTTADKVSGTTGIPKADVLNAMQSVMAVTPAKVPGGKLIAKTTRNAMTKAQDILDPKTAFYLDIAEGKAPELLAAARNPQAAIVPGTPVTFAQATADVGLPRVAAVGEQAAKRQPTQALQVKDAQEAARLAQIQAIARTPEKRAAAVKVRAKRADPLYRQAESAGDVVNVAPTLDYIDGVIDNNPGNPALLAEMRRIRKGLVRRELDANGQPVLVPRTDAKEIASTLDGIKAALAKEDNRFIKSELTAIKDDLEQAIPQMKEAQATFKKGSRPINQMDVGQYLRDKLEAPVPTGTPRAGVFANAVREAPRTIRQALDGGPTYEALTDILSPAQKANVDRVMLDLARDQRVKELAQMGRDVAPDLGKSLGDTKFPSLLNRLATIANEILRRLEGKINEKMALEIAAEFLDADRAAAALETAVRRRTRTTTRAKTPASPVARAVKRAPVITAPNQMGVDNRNAMAR